MADSYASLLELTCSCASAVHVHQAVIWQRLPLAGSGSTWAVSSAPVAAGHFASLDDGSAAVAVVLISEFRIRKQSLNFAVAQHIRSGDGAAVAPGRPSRRSIVRPE